MSVSSQRLRIKRLCFHDYKEAFRKSEKVVLYWKSRKKILGPKGMESKNVWIPFKASCHPYLKSICKVIKKHIKHLYANPNVRSVFTALPYVPFFSVRNFRSHLVGSNQTSRNKKLAALNVTVHVFLLAIMLKSVTLLQVLLPKKSLN